MEKIVIVAETESEVRLDVYLSSESDFSRSQIDKLNKSGLILVNGKSGKSGRIIRNLDVIEISVPVVDYNVLPQNIPLDILYEDEEMAVINKQRGLIVHPSGGIVTNTLVNALLYHLNGLSGGQDGVTRPGIVHRLDKDTTGVMVVAKKDSAHLNLSAQFAARGVKKIYLGILEGNLKQDEGRITTGIGRHPRNRKLMSVISGGREAITKYKVIKRFEKNCLVEFELLTGRTHQIRVHAKHLNCPLVGDEAYGFSKQRFKVAGQLLHSSSLTLTHPTSNQTLTFSAPPPDDFLSVLDTLSKEEE